MEQNIKSNTESIEQQAEKRWSHYNYVAFDPRNIPEAAENNAKIFAAGDVYGIEVTIPALAEQCEGNIDPQHTDGNVNLCAIELAVTKQLPEEGSILATVRADLDSIGAMAVLSNRLEFGFDTERSMQDGIDEGYYKGLEDFLYRIDKIAESDKFAHGGYPGPRPLPTHENPWADGSSELGAIAAAVADFKTPLADRVAVMGKWLVSGEEPTKYREQVEQDRLNLINALESGEIHVNVISARDGVSDIAIVECSHRAATTVGYLRAPVVIACNPKFKQGPGEAYKKYTICQFEDKFVDIKAVREELNALEPGWGGSPTIIGSPQGVSSQLSIEDVATIVEKHLVRQ